MNIRLEHYVGMTGKTLNQIAREIGMSRQRVHNWVARGTRVIITASADDDYQTIEKVTLEKVVYPESKKQRK